MRDIVKVAIIPPTPAIFCSLVRSRIQPHHHHRQVISRVVLDGVVEQDLGSFLGVGDFADEVDGVLIFGDVPEL